jgi:hypothetical protein
LFSIGVNAEDGIIYFIHRESPGTRAESYWSYKPHKDELPALRLSSDVAWAIWNREVNRKRKNLNGITKFMSMTVLNDDTEEIIAQAIGQWKGLDGATITAAPKWPGVDFSTASQEGLALLGELKPTYCSSSLAWALWLTQM